MGQQYRYIQRAAIGLLTASSLWGGFAVVAHSAEIKSPSNDAASSLKSVLKKAGEQGFIALDGDPKKTGAQTPKAEKQKVSKKSSDPQFGSINCKVTSALDLAIYKSVGSYDAISLTKSGLENSGTLEDVMPLVKTYMALGFGAEMSRLVQDYKGHKARLIESMGRAIDGYPTAEDQARIEQYSACNRAMRFWAEFAHISGSPYSQRTEPFELSYEGKDFLGQFPEHLKKLVTLRLGIYAAEQQSRITAASLLRALAPQSKYGELPELKDDGLLYFYGLVRQMEKDSTAPQIFKHLAERDGLYRVQSLQKLAEENIRSGAELYENFSEDLATINQQYKGQTESRKATLQIVKHRILTDRFIEAIEEAKREFAVLDSERAEAVTFAAERLQDRLKDELHSRQLLALNAYFNDPKFFEAYENLPALKLSAKDAAINLNLPELVAGILPRSEDLSQDEKNILAYAETLIAAKSGDYEKVIKTSKSHAGDPKYQALILEAAVKSGDYKQTVASLKRETADAKRFAVHSDIAWQNGRWGEAKIALEALAHKKPDEAIAAKIAIANYVGVESLAYVNRAVPKTAADLDLLKTQLDKDIALVKGYLSNG